MALFPCMNSDYGCMEKLLPENVEQYKLICLYQKKSCVFDKTKKCTWKGRFNQLLDHYRSDHGCKEMFDHYKTFKINVNENVNISNLLRYKDEMFLFEYNFDQLTKNLKCSLTGLGFDHNINKYYALIKLKADKWELSYEFPQIRVDGITSESIDIDIKNMSNVNNTIVMGTIKISSCYQLISLDYNTQLYQKLSSILSLMDCFVCSGVFRMNINVCQYGHYTCNNCKNKCCTNLDQANTIEYKIPSQFYNIRRLIYSSCQYGCGFEANVVALDEHHLTCNYAPFSCVLKDDVKCEWKGYRKNLIHHICTDHKNRFRNVEATTTTFITVANIYSNKLEQYYKFVNDHGDLYYVTVSHEDDSYCSFHIEQLDQRTKYDKTLLEVCIADRINTKKISQKKTVEKLRGSLPDRIYKGVEIQFCEDDIKSAIGLSTVMLIEIYITQY